MYEMSMGKAMSGVFPEEADYTFGQYGEDDSEGITAFTEKCNMFREILEFIFARKEDGRLAHNIKQVSLSIIDVRLMSSSLRYSDYGREFLC